MVLFLIGLGLGDETDITMKGFQAIQTCELIYLETYTSVLGVDKAKLEKFYNKTILDADRETMEIGVDAILEQIKENQNKNSAFLVVGDPFGATTHTDLYLRAIKLGLEVQVIHNASIMNAVGCCGLQLYTFGQTVSIPFFTEKWRPYSFYEKILVNRQNGMHTLVLLDIKVKEISEENLCKGKKIYEPPRFMTTKIAAEQLLEAEQQLKKNAYDESTMCFGLARVGQKDQKIISGTLKQFLSIDMGQPLHSFIICNNQLHDIEEEFFKKFLYQQQ